MPFPSAPSIGTLYTNPLGSDLSLQQQRGVAAPQNRARLSAGDWSLDLGPGRHAADDRRRSLHAGPDGLWRHTRLHLRPGRWRVPSGPLAGRSDDLRHADDRRTVCVHDQGDGQRVPDRRARLQRSGPDLCDRYPARLDHWSVGRQALHSAAHGLRWHGPVYLGGHWWCAPCWSDASRWHRHCVWYADHAGRVFVHAPRHG